MARIAITNITSNCIQAGSICMTIIWNNAFVNIRTGRTVSGESIFAYTACGTIIVDIIHVLTSGIRVTRMGLLCTIVEDSTAGSVSREASIARARIWAYIVHTSSIWMTVICRWISTFIYVFAEAGVSSEAIFTIAGKRPSRIYTICILMTISSNWTFINIGAIFPISAEAFAAWALVKPVKISAGCIGMAVMWIYTFIPI